MEFHAQTIMQHASFSFVLPNDVEMAEVREPRHYERPTKTLILLHGLTGTDTDWLYGGVAQDMAIQYNLAVFMPAAGNHFYLDHGYPGGDWGRFTGEEFPDYIRKVFGCCDRREDTLIGGLSMGGYGALHTALAYPERFSGCIALSGLYDSNYFFSGWMNDTLYDNSPECFLPNMSPDHPYIDLYNEKQLIICVGQGAWEEDGVRSLRFLESVFREKGINAWCDFWGYDVNHDWPWWYKQMRYFVPIVLERWGY